MAVELKPCDHESCQHYRAWYRTGMNFYQKMMDAPGKPDTIEFCQKCEHFKRFNLLTLRVKEGHGDKE